MKIFKRKHVDKNAEASEETTKKTRQRRFSIKDLVNGNLLTKEFVQKQLPFILFLTALALFYINNRFTYEAKLKEHIKLKKELKDAKYRSLIISKELMQTSNQSAVIKRLRENGSELQESVTPPVEIK
ncbi:MAG: hypothetical protein LBS16_00290 [Prevotellaceae bacterium]|jgi:cell division protein FtsL|nr:hypothetical protein [Prevotellaceae bacterium]